LEIETVPLGEFEITVVYDNKAVRDDLGAAWGFSCTIEGPEDKILFDTGADGELLLQNMKELACDPTGIQLVVLSHQHWDHVDGLEEFLQVNSDVEVLLLESFPEEIRETISGSGAVPREVDLPTEICPGVYSTGPMGSDPDEQSLFIATDRGSIVITGCAHPGIVDIVSRVRELTGQDILLVMGGFHLRSHSDGEVLGIIEDFRDIGVRYAGPCHCTGEGQIGLFREAYGDHFIDIGVGRVLSGADLD
jgi:7,8-dihydropterin-6-yl-methyl-4-(beta-D-ribofuranosyl)aminobenzene 5'-phosphate synthase